MEKTLYVKISEDITKQIKSGDLKEHDKLSERKLAEQYQVSRVVVRDAMKLLKEKGLISTQAGSGSYVSIPNGEDIMERFEQAMTHSCIAVADAIEAREIMELSYIPLIAKRATKNNVLQLRAIIQSMYENIEDITSFAHLDEQFHLALVACAQNEVLKMFTGTLNTITNRNRLLATIEVRENALIEHENIVKAVEENDEALLQTCMEKHLKCVRKYVDTSL